jgi:hypothetical protein
MQTLQSHAATLRHSAAALRGQATRRQRTADRAAEDRELKRDVLNTAAIVLTDVAHERPCFGFGDLAAANKKAVECLLAKAIAANAIRSLGGNVWAVVDEESLCECVFKGLPGTWRPERN